MHSVVWYSIHYTLSHRGKGRNRPIRIVHTHYRIVHRTSCTVHSVVWYTIHYTLSHRGKGRNRPIRIVHTHYRIVHCVGQCSIMYSALLCLVYIYSAMTIYGAGCSLSFESSLTCSTHGMYFFKKEASVNIILLHVIPINEWVFV